MRVYGEHPGTAEAGRFQLHPVRCSDPADWCEKDGGIRESKILDGKTVALPLATAPERLVRGIIEQKKLNVRVMPCARQCGGLPCPLHWTSRRLRHRQCSPLRAAQDCTCADDFIVVGRALDYSPYGSWCRKAAASSSPS